MMKLVSKQGQSADIVECDFVGRSLRARLKRALGSARMPNGTSAIEAVAVALMADRSYANASVAEVAALTDEQLFQAFFDVNWLLSRGGGGPITLPFGTETTTSTFASLTIGAQEYVLVAGRPGLHEMEIVSRAAHGPNLDRLAASIARRTRKLACRRLGAPVPRHIMERDSYQLLQFAPLPEAGGVVLQRSVLETGADRFCAALPLQIEEFAEDVVVDMRALWNRRAEVKKVVERVRLAAEAGIMAEPGLIGHVRIKAITLDLQYQRDNGDLGVHVEYDGLDEALRQGSVIDHVPARSHHIEAGCWPVPHSLLRRIAELESLQAFGATGLIDDMAAAVARAAPEGSAAVLARLAGEYETQVRIPTASGPLFASLYWRDGTIQVDLSMGGVLDWYADRLELQGVSLTSAQLAKLPGQPVRDLPNLPDLPFACGGVIRKAEAFCADCLRVDIDLGTSLVNCGTGRIWDVPEDAAERLRFG